MTPPVLLGVAGLAGGAGTSTVALALGGLLAWRGREVLVAGDEDLLRLCGLTPWTGPGTGELAMLGAQGAAEEVHRLSRPLPGLERLRVVGGGAGGLGATAGWPFDVVVADRRLDARDAPALLVARADGCLAAAAGRREPVLVRDGGPLHRAGARRLLGRAPDAWVRADPRVARAGLAGRVPAGLPGRWLAGLRDAVSTAAQQKSGQEAPRSS